MPSLAIDAPSRTRLLEFLRRVIPFLGRRGADNGFDSGVRDASVHRSGAHSQWIQRAAETCEAAARGDLEVRMLRCHEGTDIERLVLAINDLLDRTEAFVREAGAPLEAANQQRFYRRVVLRGMLGSFRRTSGLINRACQEMARDHAALCEASENRRALADQFEAGVQKVVSELVTSATRVNGAAHELAAAAGSASGSSQSAIDSSLGAMRRDSSSQSTIPPASSSSVMTASSLEKNSSAPQVLVASRTRELNAVVGDLVEASQRIGGVVKLISQIAAQTNLLALNATIEAARAGEVGRGFGVVANEVKSLSQQTAKATDQIRREITAVRVTAQSTADLVGSMSRRISEMSDISSHVSEQAAELSGSVDNFLRTIRA
jgi:methyl-accepting chemotaxis protein